MSNKIKELAKQVIRVSDIPEVEVTGKFKFIDEKIIQTIEKQIRGSFEYKNYISFLKKELDINSCTFYQGYSIKNGFSIEIHHEPLTLYDYTYTVCVKHYEENKGWYNDLLVAQEVSALHYKFKVGLVPLNPTAHELVHSGNLEIHPDLIIGDWKGFLEEYKNYIPQTVKDKILKLEQRDLKPSDKMPIILNRKQILLETPMEKVDQNFLVSMVENKLKKIQ